MPTTPPHPTPTPSPNPPRASTRTGPTNYDAGRGREGTHHLVPVLQPRELCSSMATRGRAPPPRAEAAAAAAAGPAGLTEDKGGGAVTPGRIPRNAAPSWARTQTRKTKASDAAPRPPPGPRPALRSSVGRSRAPSWPSGALRSGGARAGGMEWGGAQIRRIREIYQKVESGAGGA